MKRILFAFCGSAILLGSCAQSQPQNECTVTGHLDSIKNNALVACVTDEQLTRTERLDTIYMENGNFTYTLKGENVRSVVFVPMPSEGKRLFEEDFGYISILMAPGEKGHIEGTTGDYKISGSEFFRGMQKANKMLEDLTNEVEAERAKFSERIKNGEDKETVSAEYEKYIGDWKKRQADAVKGYIKANSNCSYAYTMLPMIGKDSLELYRQLFPEEIRNSVVNGYVEILLERERKMMEAQAAREKAAEKIKPGMPAPDFTLTDINGKPLSLSSLKGKYVVLDFWGSWCGWCIKGIPQMKEYYSKYKGKFEILGIACNDTPQAWKAAVEKHELPWLNVINSDEHNVSNEYGISGYPTKIIVDKKGNIEKVIVGESPEFYAYLDSLFK